MLPLCAWRMLAGNVSMCACSAFACACARVRMCVYAKAFKCSKTLAQALSVNPTLSSSWICMHVFKWSKALS